MAPLRLVVITPRYWPQAGDLECATARIAESLAEAGSRVTVLTASWSPDWPTRYEKHHVSVQRVPYAPRNGWSAYRYAHALQQWLHQHRREFDVAYAMTLGYEASAAVEAFRGTSVPVLLRTQTRLVEDEPRRSPLRRRGGRTQRLCSQSSAVIVPHAALATHLVEEGCDPRRLQVILPGASFPAPRTADRRFRARAALVEANYDLAAAEYAPVALYIGRLDPAANLAPLIRDWQDIAARWPSARLWLVGDGPSRDALRAQVQDTDLRYQVFLPGSFEDWEDLFVAADLLLAPSLDGRTQVIAEALGAGLPVLAAEGPDLNGMLEHHVEGLIVPQQSRGTWSAALSQMFENPSLLAAASAAARRRAAQQLTLRALAASHLDVIHSIVQQQA